jgi:hypothetical protein
MPAKWRTHVLHYVPPDAPPPPTAQQIADALAAKLRANGATELPTLVSGPVVVLDFDTGAITVHCAAAALQVAQELGAKLADLGRAMPHCSASTTSFTCMQLGRGKEFMIVELEDLDQPQLTSAIVGAFPPKGRLGSQMAQLKAQVATATCP